MNKEFTLLVSPNVTPYTQELMVPTEIEDELDIIYEGTSGPIDALMIPAIIKKQEGNIFLAVNDGDFDRGEYDNMRPKESK